MFKIKLIFLLLITLLTSCEKFFTDEEHSIVFEKSLISSLSFDSDFKFNSKFPLNKTILRPVGVWQRLLETKNYCLDYRLPSKKKSGVLSLSKVNSEGLCLPLPVDTSLVRLKEVSDFKIVLLNDHLNGKKIRNGVYGIELFFKYKKDQRNIKISLINLKREVFSKKNEFSKYESSGTKMKRKGLRVSREGEIRLRSMPWLKSVSSNESSKGSLNFCERIDSSCETIGKSTCNECEGGWLPVVDFNCPNGGSKVCAPMECGKKGMPACVRGTRWKGVEMHDLCFDDSPAGFCEGELKTICDDNKILVCI